VILDQPVAETLSLTRGEHRCGILPHLGGCIGTWSSSGQQMLRPVSAAGLAARDPYATAGFPLVPFSNRIGDGRFAWNGKAVTLARNFPPEPHAIHGVGFERPWQILSRTNDSALLALLHLPDAGWPWAFEARQRITLTDGALTLDLSAVNLEAQAVPLAFGHHPYIPRSGARLTFHAQGVWLPGEDGLPGDLVKPTGSLDFSKGLDVEQADVDHCFSGWSRAAYIVWPDQPLALEITASSALSCAVVYSSRELDAFCFEPVAHANNALNRQDGESPMPVVAPGGSFSASIRFSAIKR
jgi:aldose 1-epimerase